MACYIDNDRSDLLLGLNKASLRLVIRFIKDGQGFGIDPRHIIVGYVVTRRN